MQKNSETLFYDTMAAKETVTKNYEDSNEDFWNTNEKLECQLRVKGYSIEDKDKEMDKLKEENALQQTTTDSLKKQIDEASKKRKDRARSSTDTQSEDDASSDFELPSYNSDETDLELPDGTTVRLAINRNTKRPHKMIEDLKA